MSERQTDQIIKRSVGIFLNVGISVYGCPITLFTVFKIFFLRVECREAKIEAGRPFRRLLQESN